MALPEKEIAVFNTIIFSKEKHIATITLNRPENMNAMNLKMFEELEMVQKEIKNDADVRVLVITGKGNAFCSGADFSLVTFLSKFGSKEFMEKLRYLQSVVTMIEEMEKPVIAAINGFALGGGLDLALACDLRLAVEGVKMGEQYIKVGIMPDLGGTQRLPRLIGLAKAKEMIFFGEMINAEEAERIGLVNHIFSRDDFESETTAIAQRLAAGPSVAIGLAKKAINEGCGRETRSGLELEVQGQSLCMQTVDVEEGIAAFREKRAPQFRGK